MTDDQLLRPIQEASYLTAGNAWRYRTILRYFYRQHERLRHYLFAEEVYRHLKENPHFADYTEEQLQQDLDQLVEWKNLIPRQETGRVSSIEEFKKKKFRYQLTPYTIEIERMVTGLEKLGDGYGGSLERTLFDRLLQNLLKLTARSKHPVSGEMVYEMPEWDGETLHRLWEDLFDDFRKLTENATDYLAHLQSEKVEEKMMTEAFLLYKDAVTEYLRNFMSSLQRTSFRIESVLEETEDEFVRMAADKLAAYERSIPRLEEQPDAAELAERYRDRWQVLKTWFVGSQAQESDMMYLQNATNETIRRLTRFAQRLGETHHNLRSRRNDYMYLAEWFAGLEDVREAHELSACAFGVMNTRHLYVEKPKSTENVDADIWREPPSELIVRPRVRAYREKQKPNAVVDRTRQKQEMLEKYMEQKERERRLLEELVQADRIVFADLPELDPSLRKTLLSWIARCMSNPDRTARSEEGKAFKLIVRSDRTICLRARDGSLEMPDYMLQFLA